jgi:hypothetical protein
MIKLWGPRNPLWQSAKSPVSVPIQSGSVEPTIAEFAHGVGLAFGFDAVILRK